MNTLLKVAFIDRDGTIIEEPADGTGGELERIRFLPGVIPALLELRRAGFTLVMAANQGDRGVSDADAPRWRAEQDFILRTLASQGITFSGVFICPHRPVDHCACRKPRLGLLTDFLAAHNLDRTASIAIGDQDSDLEFAAALGIRGFLVQAGTVAQHAWPTILGGILAGARSATVERRTRETSISVSVALDRETPVSVRSGIGFLDHMIEQIARHGGFSMTLECSGDLEVDEHHTVEDCALALGAALRQALGEKLGIGRYGFVLPMDEARAQVALDLSARPYLLFEGRFRRERVGELPTELVPHFFRSLADALGAAIHISVIGQNAHHMVESCFKGVGRALRQAIRIEGSELPSSKGTL